MTTKPSDADDGRLALITPVIRTTMPARRRRRRRSRATGGAAKRGAAQGGGELRILLDEGALHLLEQSQLLFGEWHGSSPVAPDGPPVSAVASLGSGPGVR